MIATLLDKVKYKKVRVGLVQRNGKTYIKYRKVPRYKVSQGLKKAILSVFILAALGFSLKFLLSM
jgi:hypothetical protein